MRVLVLSETDSYGSSNHVYFTEVLHFLYGLKYLFMYECTNEQINECVNELMNAYLCFYVCKFVNARGYKDEIIWPQLSRPFLYFLIRFNPIIFPSIIPKYCYKMKTIETAASFLC